VLILLEEVVVDDADVDGRLRLPDAKLDLAGGGDVVVSRRRRAVDGLVLDEALAVDVAGAADHQRRRADRLEHRVHPAPVAHPAGRGRMRWGGARTRERQVGLAEAEHAAELI